MSAEAKLTLPEIARRTGAEYRTLHSWVERGLLKPSVYQSTGSGKPSLYSERDAEVASALVHLRYCGAGMDALALVAAEWNRDPIATCPCCRSTIVLDDYQSDVPAPERSKETGT